MEEIQHEICLDAKSIPTKTVIVYSDRAEVKRLIRTNFQCGKTALIIQNLSSVIERQSIRVEGHRLAQISNVQFEEIPLNNQTETHLKLSELETLKADKEVEQIAQSDEIHILRKRLDVLDGVAGQVRPLEGISFFQIGQSVLHSVPPENEVSASVPLPSSFLLCNEAMQNLSTFLQFYSKTASELRAELREKEKHLASLHEDIDLLEKQIDQFRCRLEYDCNKRSLRIVVETATSGEAEIFLSYQVYCVSWRPSYDVRASTSSELKTETDENADPMEKIAETTNRIHLSYYGVVEQKTDEDWKNVELVLSTATPCIAGTLPQLPVLTASLQKGSPFRPRNFSNQRKPLSNGSEEDVGIGSFEYNEYTDAAHLQRLTIARSNSDTEVNQIRDLPCFYFPIEQSASIISNGSPHRVLIAELELEPEFVHETVPSKAASAFLSALILNTSVLPLLTGQASVFLNNSFICQSYLHTVLPGEQFCCALGADPAVKIEYRPAKRTNEKIGFMSKSSLITHEQVIAVRNAKFGEKIRLTVREPIPKSADEKIKVCVIAPDVRSGRTEAILNRDNHLEWDCRLEPGDQRELLIRYTMEFPLNENIVCSPNGIGSSQRVC